MYAKTLVFRKAVSWGPGEQVLLSTIELIYPGWKSQSHRKHNHSCSPQNQRHGCSYLRTCRAGTLSIPEAKGEENKAGKVERGERPNLLRLWWTLLIPVSWLVHQYTFCSDDTDPFPDKKIKVQRESVIAQSLQAHRAIPTPSSPVFPLLHLSFLNPYHIPQPGSLVPTHKRLLLQAK